MEKFYYVSEGIVDQFPELERSSSFPGFNKRDCYIVIINDFSNIEEFFKNYNGNDYQFAYECVGSLVDLNYDAIDYDEDDNEIEVVKTLNLEVCKEWGFITAIEQELGLTKEQNIAYVIFKLAQQSKVNPIELIDLIG